MPAPVMGGSLKGVIPPSITDMDPVTIYDQGGIVLIQQVCEYLIALDDKNGLKASLATEWSGSADATTWTFKLRQGVMFNDGSPMEAADVVASMERVVDPKSGSGALAALAGHPLARRHHGGRHLHRRVQARQAVRRLPVPGLPVLVQHGHPAAHLQRQLREEARRHRPLRAAVVQRQAAGRDGQEPHVLGQGRRRQPAAVPRSGHLGHGAGRIGRQPAAAVRRRRLPAADRVPGLAGAVRRSEPARGHLSWQRHPRGRLQPPEGALEERSQGAPPGRRLLPRPPMPSTRPCTTVAATSATTPSGSRRSSPAAPRRPSARRTTTRPSSCSPPPASPTGPASS